MPRYLIERAFSPAAQQNMSDMGSRMKRTARDNFPAMTWEHSHVVTGASGLKTFCVYDAPDVETVRLHAEAVGEQSIDRIYEIAGDVTPADFAD
jgi:hypothetical protein